MISKYCPNSSIIEWFRQPVKSQKNSSIGWKIMVQSFPLIGSWMAWRIRDGKNVRVGEDPWVGA